MGILKTITFIVCFLLVAIPSFAIEPGEINCAASNTWCAASCTQADLQTAVNSALASGRTDVIVYAPPCDIAWTPGQKLIIATGLTKNLRLIGSGETTTKIKYFQLGIGTGGTGMYTNLIEWGHMTAYSDGVTLCSIQQTRMRAYPSQIGKELYWHNLSVLDYKLASGSYTFHLEGWHGVVSNVTIRSPTTTSYYGFGLHGDGQYSNHKPDIGTRNALFFEGCKFYYTYHPISLFCDAYAVFRYNEVHYAKAYVDIHGANYNACAPDYPGNVAPNNKHGGGGYEVYNNKFYNYQLAWLVSPRTGSAVIVTNNSVEVPGTETAFVCERYDTTSCTASVNCGTGVGQTCTRKYSINTSDGCLQGPENHYIWGNTGVRELYQYNESTCATMCTRVNVDYFNRAPTLVGDGFTWTAYQYPHPLVSGGSNPVSNPLPPPNPPPNAPKNLHIINP